MDEQETKPTDPISENRVKLFTIDRQLLAEMFIQGRKNAFEIIENGLPTDAVCIDGGIVDDELRLVICSKEFEVYNMEPVDGKIPLMPTLPGAVARRIDLPVNNPANGQI